MGNRCRPVDPSGRNAHEPTFARGSICPPQSHSRFYVCVTARMAPLAERSVPPRTDLPLRGLVLYPLRRTIRDRQRFAQRGCEWPYLGERSRYPPNGPSIGSSIIFFATTARFRQSLAILQFVKKTRVCGRLLGVRFRRLTVAPSRRPLRKPGERSHPDPKRPLLHAKAYSISCCRSPSNRLIVSASNAMSFGFRRNTSAPASRASASTGPAARTTMGVSQRWSSSRA